MFLMRFCIIKESIEFLIDKYINVVNLGAEKYKNMGLADYAAIESFKRHYF